jgi:hypothetical protein
VHRCGQRLQLAAGQELHLIDEEHDACLVLTGRPTEFLEEVGQVPLKIAGDATHRVWIEGEVEVAFGARPDLEASQHPCERSQAVSERLTRAEVQ